jgi:hypothetical protein
LGTDSALDLKGYVITGVNTLYFIYPVVCSYILAAMHNHHFILKKLALDNKKNKLTVIDSFSIFF